MKSDKKAPKKLTLTKDTVRDLKVQSHVQAGNWGPSFFCSMYRDCPTNPK